MRIIIDINGDDVQVTKFEVDEDHERIDSRELSCYAAYFDDSCVGWTKDSEFNKMFLLSQQQYCNDKLRHDKHLFLNDVYDILGIPRTKAGQVVGWIYDEDNMGSDNYVDFGLYSDVNRKFINGYTRIAILDFNVYGNILNEI